MTDNKKQIGKILLRQRALHPDDLDRALTEHGEGRLASRLAREGTISDTAALKALSEQHGIPGIDLSQICLRLDQLEILPREIAEKYRILPVLEREDRLFVAMVDPREKSVIDELEFVTGKRVYPYVALESALVELIEHAYTRKMRGDAYYIGPNCPPALLAKLGIDADGNPLVEESMFPEPAAEAPPLSAPGVVVDDEMGDASRADDLSDQDFGDVSREHSVVADVSDSALAPGAKTILVVDDEPDIRKMLVRLLGRAGHRVIEAERGLQALRLVKEHPPDLIVLDAMLPELHGFDIARRIKHSERYRDVPIIMISAVYRGWRYAEDLKQSCGVDHFIEKPFRIAEVMSAVDACFKTPSRNPPDPERNLSAEAEQALNQGIEAYQKGEIDAAIQHLKRGVGIDPLAFRLHFHLGLLYGKRGQVFEAIAALESAVASNGQHFPTLKNLAILYQKAGFRNRAVETWERALALAPDEATRQSIRAHLLKLL
jgi:DNA-binding response OmpR family regulator